MRKHVIRTLMILWKFLSRKIIELHLNLKLHTTVINLFVYCTIIVYIINDYIILNFKSWGRGGRIFQGPPLYEILLLCINNAKL